MPMIEVNRNPSRKELWVFVLLLPVFLAVLGGLFYYHELTRTAVVLWCVAVPAGLLGAAGVRWCPGAVRCVYVWWIYAVFPIGWTVSHLAMALIYYLAITPIGLLLRLFGHDPMQRKLDRSVSTYWQRHDPSDKPGHYFRQF